MKDFIIEAVRTGCDEGGIEMKKRVKEAIAAELEYIDGMSFGDSDTTARIMHKLGFEDLSFDDLFDVEYGVYEEVEKSRDYILDKSAHDDKVEGLPFHLDFVKKKDGDAEAI